MPDLTYANNPITDTGEYFLSGLVPGREYLLTLKGTFNSAMVTLLTYNDALGDYTSVDDGFWTSEAEARLIMPSSKAKLIVSEANNPVIGFTLTMIL